MNLIQFILHLVAASTMGFALYYDTQKVVFPAEFTSTQTNFAGRCKYLTFLNAILQFIYYSLCVVNDLLGSNSRNGKSQSKLQKIRDFLFGSLVFPLAMFVSGSFWTLMAIDRELVFPKIIDTFYPSWLNHSMHSVILPFALISTYIVPRVYPARRTALRTVSLVMIGYIGWVFFIAFHTGYWVYPVLEVLNWPYRIAFITLCAAIGGILSIMGEQLHVAIWGKEARTGKDGAKKGKKSRAD